MSKLIENIKRLAAMIKGETQSGGNTAARVGGLFEDISCELELKYDRAESDRILSGHDTSDVSHQNIQDKINGIDQDLAGHAGTLSIHKTSEQIRGEIVDADIPVTLARVSDVDAKDAVILSDAKKYATDHVDMLSNDVYHKVESYNRTEIDNKDAAVLNNSKEFVTAKIAELVGGSPAALDTLYEIARAMNNDPNFGTSVIAMINGKSDLVHSHTKSQITDFPTSLPASGGNADTVDGLHAAAFQPAGSYAAGTHSHTKSQITDFPASLPANGGNADTVDGLHANSFARACLGINFGGTSGNITTEEFLTILNNNGAFNQPFWSSRGSWFYAGNKIISDTGTGRIHLAGASIEVISDSSIRVTIRITTAASTPDAEPKRVFVYTKNETTTAWFKLANSTDIPTSLPASGGDAHTVDGLHAAAMGTVEASKLVSYDANGYIKASIFRDTFPLDDTLPVGAVAYKISVADGYHRFCSLARFKTILGSLPASDVYAWAKAATKPTYTAAEVGAAATTHTHTASQITEQTNKRFMTDAERTKLAGLTPTIGISSWATVKYINRSLNIIASGGLELSFGISGAGGVVSVSNNSIDFTKHAVIVTPHFSDKVPPLSVHLDKQDGTMAILFYESAKIEVYWQVGFDIVII